MRGDEDNKWVMAFIALAVVTFLLVTSPGWTMVLGIEGNEVATLTSIILIFYKRY